MFKQSNARFLLSVTTLLVVSFICISNKNYVECTPVSSQENLSMENLRSRVYHKAIKSYLLAQLSQVDELIEEDDALAEAESSSQSSVEKRQLKSQGIMERLKNKMEHDLNKYGWD